MDVYDVRSALEEEKEESEEEGKSGWFQLVDSVAARLERRCELTHRFPDGDQLALDALLNPLLTGGDHHRLPTRMP